MEVAVKTVEIQRVGAKKEPDKNCQYSKTFGWFSALPEPVLNDSLDPTLALSKFHTGSGSKKQYLCDIY